jgi:hypothetical protein
MLTVTSIFAGLSGALAVNMLARADGVHRDWRFYVGISAILIALFCFVWIPEQLSDALDEGKPGIYVRAMYRFNLAVLCAFASISAFVSWLDTHPILETGLPAITFGDVAGFAIVFATLTWGPWWRDAIFLYDRLSAGVDDNEELVQIANDAEWNKWIKRLLDKEE